MRQHIRDRFATATALAHASGVDPRVIQRFLDGERDIRLETAGRIATALGVRLVANGRARTRKDSGPEGENESARRLFTRVYFESESPANAPEPAIEPALEAPADVDAREAVSG